MPLPSSAAERPVTGPSADRAALRAPSFVVGLVGRGIQLSKTPAMHEREADELGLRYVYRLIDFDRLGLPDDDLGSILTAARRLGFAGLNVTHPFKQAVIAHLDGLSDDARALGAVNTVVFEGDRAIGHNTDWWGFAESFRRSMAGQSLESAILFGAGGAGVAVAHALLTLGIGRLTVVDTDPARAAALAGDLCARFGAGRAEAGSAADAAHSAGIVNATPVGMAKYPGLPLPAALIRPDHWVADIVYFPLETELLATARAKGCRILAGGGMAVFQAVGAFRLFTGAEPDPDRMRAHFDGL
jgi:shikimate dehydrogenase